MPRVTVEFANSSRQQMLSYPTELFNDHIAPQFSDIVTHASGKDSVTISWITDEFANSQINYGTTPDNYTEMVSNGLYSEETTPTFVDHHELKSTDCADYID